MKRIHLFEFEDMGWFPNWLRIPMTRFLVTFHKMMGSSRQVSLLLHRLLELAPRKQVVDLCSGGGGPMPDVLEELRKNPETKNISLTLTDLFPNVEAAARINGTDDPQLRYLTDPVDAAATESVPDGLRTMVGSFHHMRPEVARRILQSARDARQPILIYEVSDNSSPKFLWWISIPFVFIMTLFMTPFIRPMTWQQIVFTYFIPLLPLLIAWDGAVSNARTYSQSDVDELLKGLDDPGYQWEKGVIKGKARKSYLMGWPV